MAELTTVARPYAQAVFKLASETQRLGHWSEMLQFAAAVASNESMAHITEGTLYSKDELAQLFIDICAERLDDEGRNLIRVLAQYRRLMLLPEIAAVYENYRAEAERTIDAQMTSAYEVTETQRVTVAEALAARLGRKVNLTTTTDSSLLGGAVIRAGDMVIDGSVRGKLGKLATAMSH